MKTEITRFCETLRGALADLSPALADTAEQMETRPELGRPLAALRDLQARLRALSDKLANQHAYLLIFGPLKSGKSTLMNAISGAYVSEVTSLPGYPALVFVQHAAEPGFVVTRYNGRESTFADPRVLRELVGDSHAALAEQIRAAEMRGDEFDPRRHFSEAVRRIDVRMPVANLAESGTVLVDTPGLYSRMNFSYDILTREFRDSAACAVFVVKTDNLFLEQVFAEFQELLDLFSRIFLVVNVDSGKRDLQPDGTLSPSAESEHPQRIIEAFKALSMEGPLRRACEQGRLRIHAVDLMQAASAALSRGAQSLAAFDAFQRDLTDYLNSSAYTREFIRDSLRQSHTLCDELAEMQAGLELTELRTQQDGLAGQIAASDARLAAFDRLLRVDWSASFGEARIANAQRSVRAAEDRADELGSALEAALDRWYTTADSLKSLEQQHWNPLIRRAGVALAEDAARHLCAALATPVGGASPPRETMIDLHAVGFDLTPIGRAALGQLQVTDTAEPYRIPVKSESVPVRKSFPDWLLLRSAATVARRLFGEDRTQSIAPEVKRQRLPEESRTALQKVIYTALTVKFPDLPARSAVHLLEHYIARYCQGVADGLHEGRAQAAQERADLQEPFDRNARIAAAMQTLHERVGQARAGILALGEKEHVLPLAPEPVAPVAFVVSEAVPLTVVRKESTA